MEKETTGSNQTKPSEPTKQEEPTTKKPATAKKPNFFKQYKFPVITGVIVTLLLIFAGMVKVLTLNLSTEGANTDNITATVPNTVSDNVQADSGSLSTLPNTGLGTPIITLTGVPSISPSLTAPAVSATPIPTVPTTTAGPTTTAFQVTAVTGSVDRSPVNACDHNFTYTYQITANRAGTVVYHTHRSDDSDAAPSSITFASAGTQTVSSSWDFSCTGICSNWQQLVVTEPNSVSSDQVTSVLDCIDADYSGTWYHNFGTAHLDQSGNTVTGTYYNGFDSNSGTISGSVSSSVLSGSWSKSGSNGSLLWSKSGNQFTGNYNGSFNWCGARAGSTFPSNCSFSGDWKMKMGDPEICPGGEMNLVISVTSSGVYNVSGTYCYGTITGTIIFQDGTAVLNGTWTNAGSGSGALKFWLVNGYNATQFRGHYKASDLDQQFCGWRSGSSQPGTCLR